MVQNLTGPVILVDDDAAVRKSLKFSLESEGIACEVYASGTDLLARPNFPSCGCLVIDYQMPDINGIDLLKRLRERQVECPALLITPQATAELRERAAASGFVGVIEKPLQETSFYTMIHRVLSRCRAK